MEEVSLTAEYTLEQPVRIGVAEDEAFCFFYEDNFNLLKEMGAELVPFSPIHDKRLPENLDGLLLYGGYPELNGKMLEQNQCIKTEIRDAVNGGMPCMAECGGFMYLHEEMEDMEGRFCKMAGVIPAECQYMGTGTFWLCGGTTAARLTEKGTAERPEPEKIKAHEFHYFDSTANGEDCIATKPVTGRSWKCIHASDDHFWGFPHLYYPSDPKFVKWFLERTEKHI